MDKIFESRDLHHVFDLSKGKTLFEFCTKSVKGIGSHGVKDVVTILGEGNVINVYPELFH